MVFSVVQLSATIWAPKTNSLGPGTGIWNHPKINAWEPPEINTWGPRRPTLMAPKANSWGLQPNPWGSSIPTFEWRLGTPEHPSDITGDPCEGPL